MDLGERSDSRHLDRMSFCGSGSQGQLLLEQLACLGPGRNQTPTTGHLPKQSTDVGRLHNLQKFIACIVLEAVHLRCRVIKGKTLLLGKSGNAFLVESLFALDLEIGLIVEKDQSHHTPEVVDPVGIEEFHGPTRPWRREAAQEEHRSVAGKKRREGVGFEGHGGGGEGSQRWLPRGQKGLRGVVEGEDA